MESLNFHSQIIEKNQRLDKFLLAKLLQIKPEFSRSRVQNLISSGCVFLQNQANLNCSYKIKGNENFMIKLPKVLESEITAKNIAFEVIFEDESMLVINKPAGLTTHPGNGNFDNTLVNGLLFYCAASLSGINGIMRPGIVHRLDKDTSGLMVVAKTDLAHQELAKQIEQRILKRNYLAFCYKTPKTLSGIINKNIARSRVNRLKMVVVRSGGRVAVTHYQVEKAYLDGLFSLISCKLETGRTHQIRVHLNSIGHSIIGDQTYCGCKGSLGEITDIKNIIKEFPRQALHSSEISFIHPISKKEMSFKSQLPLDIDNLKQALETNYESNFN